MVLPSVKPICIVFCIEYAVLVLRSAIALHFFLPQNEDLGVGEAVLKLPVKSVVHSQDLYLNSFLSHPDSRL